MNNNIKKENRKALPKFLLLLVGGMVLGGLLGACSVMAQSSARLESALAALAEGFTLFLPWFIPVVLLIFLLPAFLFVQKAKKLLRQWDGEEESSPEQIERLISVSILLSNVCMGLTMLTFTCGTIYASTQFTHLLVAAQLLAAILLIIFVQKCTVDLNRSLNPEKQGSIFDPNFHKKWLNSCDEAERKRIGEASFASYKAVTITCMILWCVMFPLHTIFNISLSVAVTAIFIFLVAQISYIVTEMKNSRKK